jgi:hypothetical protein
MAILMEEVTELKVVIIQERKDITKKNYNNF